MKSKKIIAIDVDDCLFQCVEAIFSYHNATYKTKLQLKDQAVFDLHHSFGCTPEESMQRIFDFYNSEYMAMMKPFPGAKSVLTALKKEYDLVVVTARPLTLKEVTKHSIHQYFPNIFESINLTNGYSQTGIKKLKSEICQEIGVSLLVDDSPENVYDCAQKDIKTVLFRRPWNQSMNAKELKEKNIYPADGWRSVFKVINALGV